MVDNSSATESMGECSAPGGRYSHCSVQDLLVVGESRFHQDLGVEEATTFLILDLYLTGSLFG